MSSTTEYQVAMEILRKKRKKEEEELLQNKRIELYELYIELIENLEEDDVNNTGLPKLREERDEVMRTIELNYKTELQS